MELRPLNNTEREQQAYPKLIKMVYMYITRKKRNMFATALRWCASDTAHLVLMLFVHRISCNKRPRCLLNFETLRCGAY